MSSGGYSKVAMADDDEEEACLISKEEKEAADVGVKEKKADSCPKDGKQEQQQQDDKEGAADDVFDGPDEDDSDRPNEHVVKDRETLNSIAAFYDVTPSELRQTNR